MKKREEKRGKHERNVTFEKKFEIFFQVLFGHPHDVQD